MPFHREVGHGEPGRFGAAPVVGGDQGLVHLAGAVRGQLLAGGGEFAQVRADRVEQGAGGGIVGPLARPAELAAHEVRRSVTCAPAPFTPASRSLPLAPPAWVMISVASGAGLAAYRVRSAATSLATFCAARITTTLPPPNNDGEVSRSSSPAPSAAPSRSCTSPASLAAIRSRTARSMRNSSSPTTIVTGAACTAEVRAAITAACHAGGGGAELSGDGLAAEPDAARRQAERPQERALVIGVPQHHVGEPAAHHRTPVGGAQRV